MRLIPLLVGALAFACAALAQAGTPIGVNGIPFKTGMAVADRDFGAPYRIMDDPKGLISGGRFSNLKGTPSRGGFRTSGDAHDVVFDHITLTMQGVQTGSAIPAGFEIQGTTHDVTVSNSTADSFRMDKPAYVDGSNGDGFVTEAGAYRITFIDDSGKNETDACFDNKGVAIVVIRGRCEASHRSARGWRDQTLEDFTSFNPEDSHSWAGGGAKVTVRGYFQAVSTTKAALFNCGGTVCTWDLSDVTEYRINVPSGTKMTAGGKANFILGPLGLPNMAQGWTPPPAATASPTPACPPYVLTTTQPPPNKNNGLNTKIKGVAMSLTLAPGACGHVGSLYNYVRRKDDAAVASAQP